MAVLGLRFCARAFSSCGKWGPLFIAVRGPLTIAASLVVEHRLQTHRLSNCGSQAQLLRGMWDPPRPGLEPVSPALAGRFSTTAPPGKPSLSFLKNHFVEYRIFYLRVFLFVCFKFHFSLPGLIVSDGMPPVNHIIVLLYLMSHFSLAPFKIFFCIFVYQPFDCGVSQC